jgi:hypothetical protein
MGFIKEGELRIYAEKGAVNTNVTKEDAAQRVASYNTPHFLKKTFFEGEQNILDKKILDSGSQISIVTPSAPYSEDSIMVIACGPHSFDTQPIPTQTIYDLPEDVQNEYWETIFNGIKAFKDLSSQDSNNYSIFATENCISTVTSINHRTSRSIVLPHSQIVRLIESDIEPTSSSITHLEHERKIIQNKHLLNSVDNIYNNLSFFDKLLVDNKFIPHNNPPFGYEFTFDRNASSMDITRFMKAHHEGFKSESQNLVNSLRDQNKNRIIPQPSYRLYMYLNSEGAPSVIVSPQFISHAGVIEAAGVMFDRGPHNLRRLQDQEIKNIHSLLIHKMSELSRDVQVLNVAD